MASQPSTFTSYASSPEKLIRLTRASTPATEASRQVMKGKPSRSTASPGAMAPSSSRERGPTNATVAQWSVTEVR